MPNPSPLGEPVRRLLGRRPSLGSDQAILAWASESCKTSRILSIRVWREHPPKPAVRELRALFGELAEAIQTAGSHLEDCVIYVDNITLRMTALQCYVDDQPPPPPPGPDRVSHRVPQADRARATKLVEDGMQIARTRARMCAQALARAAQEATKGGPAHKAEA